MEGGKFVSDSNKTTQFEVKEVEPIVAILQILMEKYGLEVINELSDKQ